MWNVDFVTCTFWKPLIVDTEWSAWVVWSPCQQRPTNKSMSMFIWITVTTSFLFAGRLSKWQCIEHLCLLCSVSAVWNLWATVLITPLWCLKISTVWPGCDGKDVDGGNMPTSQADTIQITTLCAEMRGVQLKVICPRGSDIAELLQQDLIIQPLHNRRR